MFDGLLRWIATFNGSEPETEQPEEPIDYLGLDWSDQQEAAQLKARALWEQS